MPSMEFIRSSNGKRNVPLAIQDLRIFWLFVCPACDAYTIHEPRLNVAGHWMVDHRREPVFQTSFDRVIKFVGLAPAESCFIDDNLAIENIECTRTVIRVK
jgi:hypothetical protein